MSATTQRTAISGFPSMGENRELKKALEGFWTGKIRENELKAEASRLRKKHWGEQKSGGIDFISSNDFSYYDRMLDTMIMLNAIPERFRGITGRLERYFAMARGNDSSVAMEMTKWFNTNYHYIVPELDSDTPFRLDSMKVLEEYREAKSEGIKTKINLIGPLTFLGLAKTVDGSDPFSLINRIVPLYKKLLTEISQLDNSITVQIEEPIFVKDPTEKMLNLIKPTYEELSGVSNKIQIVVSTYFEHSVEATKELIDTGIWGIGLDFIYGPRNFESIKIISDSDKSLFVGIVDGRNIWISDFDSSLSLLNRIASVIPKEKIIVSTSCSLLHVPYSVEGEPASEIRHWLAFAVEKTEEVAFLGKIFSLSSVGGLSPEEEEKLEWNRDKLRLKSESSLVVNSAVRERVEAVKNPERSGSFEERIEIQREKLALPSLPTTTIGSFPQTPEIRKIRRDYKSEKISFDVYRSEMEHYIDDCVALQEEIGLDVLVHGEPERNDMVEYFGENLDGFHFTKNGWVQSYGSRCVKPPIIFGDISRPKPMTVDWISYAQSRTDKIMKGMLTGPTTIINWSFVRNDIPRSEIAKQLAVALSDEIADLQSAGIRIIQVDEAAFREGYPLRKEKISQYEEWTVAAFKLTVSTAKPETQIHTHMCYSEFNDIIRTIEAMDADVITIETARSGNRLLKVFDQTGYKNEIGPGVYDIHSPRVPSTTEFIDQISQRLEMVELRKMWINPDCGLKTRKWEEVKPALENMVKAAEAVRVG